MSLLEKSVTLNVNGCAVRESYRRFPDWSQPFWTLLTGKPLPGEAPLLSMPPLAMAVATLALLLASTVAHLALLHEGGAWRLVGLWLTPVFALLAGGALRKIQVVYVHHAVHRTFIPHAASANQLAGNVFTTLALIQNPGDYRSEHFEHHNRGVFTTLADADAAFLYRFGLRPGRPVKLLRAALVKTLFSPAYHIYFLANRLRSNLVTRPPAWRLASALWLAVVAVVAPIYLGVLEAALVIWLPLVLVYQMSALLQFLTEHLWLLTERAPQEIDAYAERCVGRFCGEMLPVVGDTAGWLMWWARTLFIHVPVRLGVLVGDLPAHDWHHLCGFLHSHPAQWPIAIFSRQRAIDAGQSMGMEQRELWGLPRMLDHVFQAMSKAPSLLESSSVPLQCKSSASSSLN